MAVRKGSKTSIFPSLEIWIKNQKFLEKPEVSILIPINWFDSCNDSFLAGMKLTLHKTQVHSYSVMHWCLAVHSSPLLCLQRRAAKVASGLFCYWSLVRNNNMATNLQRFTLYYGSRRFVAGDCWTHTSWKVLLLSFERVLLSTASPRRHRGRCWAAIRLSHRPEPSDRVVRGGVDGLGGWAMDRGALSGADVQAPWHGVLEIVWLREGICLPPYLGR